METIPVKLAAARKALVAGLLAATTICAVVPSHAQNLIPANAGFEVTTPIPTTASSWPDPNTWRRGDAAQGYGITPYSDSSHKQEGASSVVLNQFSTLASSYFSLTFRGQPDPLTGALPPSTTSNLVPITMGQMYMVSFFANRWVDTAPQSDPVNQGTVSPTSLSLPEARLTLQLHTSTGDDLSGGGFFGSNLSFNPQAGGTSGAYTQGAWTQYSTTFTADKTGFLQLFYKVKDASLNSEPGYFGAGANGVKYGLDDVSVMAVPEPSTYAALAIGGCILLVATRRRKLA